MNLVREWNRKNPQISSEHIETTIKKMKRDNSRSKFHKRHTHVQYFHEEHSHNAKHYDADRKIESVSRPAKPQERLHIRDKLKSLHNANLMYFFMKKSVSPHMLDMQRFSATSLTI